MNFIDYYKSEMAGSYGGNYIIEAPEGYGKTTTLKTLYNDCKHDLEQGDGKTIPVFIRMADINVKPLEFVNNLGVIFAFVQEQYFNTNSSKATISQIIGMIKEATDYRFLFLLDGLNEVVNRELTPNGLRVLDVLENELKSQGNSWFIDYQNVDIIITTRNKAVISEELYERQENTKHRLFKIIHLEKLKSSQDYNMEMTELLSTPMLAAMYGRMQESISKEKKDGKMTKYELLSCYYELETVLNNNKAFKDYKDKRVELVLDQVLPMIALKIETAMLRLIDKNDNGKEFREMQGRGIFKIVEEILKEQDIELSLQVAVQTIKMMNIIDEDLYFSHDMIREFWTVRGIYWCTRYRDYILYSDQLKLLFEYIIKFTDRKDYYDPIRQTMHIGLMETIFSSWNGEIVNDRFEEVLKSIYAHEYKHILFQFIYNYCSILDDEVQRKAAARYAWQAYDYLKKNQDVEETYVVEGKNYELSGIYNSLGYCTNNAKIEGRSGEEVVCLLGRAKELAESIRFDGLSNSKILKIKILIGKIYNNLGACYYGAYYKDYKRALEWHEKARNYRMDNGIDLHASYRVIASDYFMLQEYQKSFEEYKKFLLYISDGCSDRLSNLKEVFIEKLKDYRYSSEIIIVILNAIGAECKLILTKFMNQDLRNEVFYEVQKEMPYQLEFCIEHMNRGSRIKAIDWIQKIQDKIKDIQEIMPYFEQETQGNLKVIFEKYNNEKNNL